MPLESASHIGQLDAANPAATDELRQGDDHIRLIKSALKATFPNINGVVSISDERLNALSADIAAAQIPIGVINLWYGSDSNVPVGWALCNGQTVSRTDDAGTITTPDLRGKVAIGALAGTYTQGQAYGSATASGNTGNAGAHTHTVNGGSHTHAVSLSGTTGSTTDSITTTSRSVDGSGGASALDSASANAHTHSVSLSGNTSADGGHVHDVSSAADHAHSISVSTLQPSLALHYIMKH
jgi:microcystin-dependent protein